MYMYRLAGTPRQIGAEYGVLLRAERVRLPKLYEPKLAFAQKCEPRVRELAPALLDELDGIAAGGGYDRDRLLMMALGLGAKSACSVVAISGEHTADGKPLFGRNLDWYRGYLHTAAFCHVAAEGALPSLGFNDVVIGRMGGINAAGLAVAITAVEGGPDKPGVMFNLAVRMVLDRCTSTAEAVEFLTGMRHARSINFLIADSSGDLAIVEAYLRYVEVIRPAHGFAVITNQFQSAAMAKHERVRRRPRDSYRRLCRLREWFHARTEPIAPAALQHVLSTPFPRGVCQGRTASRGKPTKFGTIWSWTARLGADEIELAAGTPTDVPYQPYGF